MSKQYPSTMIRFSSIVVPSQVQCPPEVVNELAQAIIATEKTAPISDDDLAARVWRKTFGDNS